MSRTKRLIFLELISYTVVSNPYLLTRNMKTKISLALTGLMLLHIGAFAQSYAFKVLVNKGKNEIRSGSGWQAIKVGASLNQTDEIKIGNNAYVGLVHVSGKPIELKEPKTWKVADLTKMVSAGSSVVTKYTDFILSSNDPTKNRLQATGAVHRGPTDLPVFLPTKPELSVYYTDQQIINWDTQGFKGPYTVTFASLFGDELKTMETAENSVTVDLEGSEFQNEDNVIVRVFSKADNKESAEFTLKKLSKADRTRIETAMKEIAEVAKEENAMSKYILAGFFENHNLLIDAATAYQQAIRLAPDVSAYQEYYNEFLLRNGIKTLPKK